MAGAKLNKEELETVLDVICEKADEALESGTREALRSALEEISDLSDADALLEVDTENGTAEVTGWEGEEGDDAENEAAGEEDERR